MDYLNWFPSRCTELRSKRGISARDMRFSLGQSESYNNKIENKRTLPSMSGFIYICEYLGITPQDFFNVEAPAPQKTKEVLLELNKLTASQADHVMMVIRDIIGEK